MTDHTGGRETAAGAAGHPADVPTVGSRAVRMLGMDTVSSHPWVVENGKEFLLGLNKCLHARLSAHLQRVLSGRALKSKLQLKVRLQSCLESHASSCSPADYCNLVAGAPSPPVPRGHHKNVQSVRLLRWQHRGRARKGAKSRAAGPGSGCVGTAGEKEPRNATQDREFL